MPRLQYKTARIRVWQQTQRIGRRRPATVNTILVIHRCTQNTKPSYDCVTPVCLTDGFISYTVYLLNPIGGSYASIVGSSADASAPKRNSAHSPSKWHRLGQAGTEPLLAQVRTVPR